MTMTENEREEDTVENMESEKESGVSVSELEKLQEEAREFKNKYLQLLADSENARKRLQKEKQELIQYAVQNILLDFLGPIDHMHNALSFTEQASEEVKHWATGFQMIMTQFQDVLANNGVRTMEAVGKEFDPHFHEAIEMVVTEKVPPGTIVEENIRGFFIGEKILRPARVKVAKAPEENSAEEKEV